MKTSHRLAAAVAGLATAAVLACSSTAPTTGLQGTVTRGPIAPVCQVGSPCTAPVAGTFTVWRGTVSITTFRSDSSGHYAVALDPGTYTIIAGSDVPVFDPSQRQQTATVGPSGYTAFDITFDTGIR